MVIPSFDLASICFGVAPCPTCSDTRMVFTTMTSSTSKFSFEEDRVREKLYGEYR